MRLEYSILIILIILLLNRSIITENKNMIIDLDNRIKKLEIINA